MLEYLGTSQKSPFLERVPICACVRACVRAWAKDCPLLTYHHNRTGHQHSFSGQTINGLLFAQHAASPGASGCIGDAAGYVCRKARRPRWDEKHDDCDAMSRATMYLLLCVPADPRMYRYYGMPSRCAAARWQPDYWVTCRWRSRSRKASINHGQWLRGPVK